MHSNDFVPVSSACLKSSDSILNKTEKRNRQAVWINLGLMEYRRALAVQTSAMQEKIDNPDAEDRIFFAQHPPVFTLGKRGGEENLIVSKELLAKKKIQIVQTDRGGNITYHAPGQAILYPVINLEKNKIGVKDFVWGLEEIMRLTAQDFNIQAERNQKNHGIWIGPSKLGSVGIFVKKGISIHGLAMNINIDLEPFNWIHPCGLAHVSMTSLEKELTKQGNHASTISMTTIKISFTEHFSYVFDYRLPHK
jgi:lipoyl(octanoyl) transferase